MTIPTGTTARGMSPTTSLLDGQILTAWRAAETAFYEAEANPKGLFSPALNDALADPLLLQVKRNLAGDEHAGIIGRGIWDLGQPRVTSLSPNLTDPTVAVVESCIHDAQILVFQSSGKPLPGLAGQPDWSGQVSTMVRSGTTWRLSNQTGLANPTKATACASIDY